MMVNWLELTHWEFAFLADAHPDEPNIVDQVASAGQWLRDPHWRAFGAELFARRVERTEDLTAEAWLAVGVAAREFVRASKGSSVLLRGGDVELGLLTAGPTQLVLKPDVVGLRLLEASIDPSDLATELREVGAPSTVVAVRWLGGDVIETLAWAGGLLRSEDTSMPADLDDAVRAVCAFAPRCTMSGYRH